MGAKIMCARCGTDAGTGAAINWSGPVTGHNAERRVLCEACVRLFQVFLSPGEHVQASDPVTTAGLVHIGVCPVCKERFGGGVSRETPEPIVITRQRIAERFTRKGLAQ